MVAEGSSGDGPKLVVEVLDEAVGEALIDVGEDVVLVFAYGPSELDEGSDSRATGPCEPVVAGSTCSCGLSVVEGGGECLLEQVGAIERSVILLDSAEFGLVFFG